MPGRADGSLRSIFGSRSGATSQLQGIEVFEDLRLNLASTTSCATPTSRATGTSRFYLALDDTLMRLFGSERIAGIMERLGLEDGQTIENQQCRSIENAQKRVEGHNFEIRKQLLEYDNVMNQRRRSSIPCAASS